MNKRIIVFLILLSILFCDFLLNTNKSNLTSIESDEVTETSNSSSMFEISGYVGDPFIYINNNQPNFTDEEKKETKSIIKLSELDQ